MTKTLSIVLFTLLAAAALAACASEPLPPLMSPLAEAGRYGYIDKQTGPNSYEITYVGPSLGTVSTRAGREQDADAAKAQAYDLALWRTAQVALDNGYEGFVVDNEDDEIEVTVREGYYPYYRPTYFGHGPYYPYRYPYYGFYGYPGSSGYRTTTLRANVTLDVSMQETAGASDFDAVTTAARMAAKYPGALTATTPSDEAPDSDY